MPGSAMQLSSQDDVQNLQTLSIENSSARNSGSVVQYAQVDDTNIYIPVIGTSGSHMYEIQIIGANPNNNSSLSHDVMANCGNLSPVEGATCRRELRLLKNREAARECRRKKKDYIETLESRVAVLESQNKALRDELTSMKKLYCREDI